MCGFFFIKKNGIQYDLNVLKDYSNSIKHRGPDDDQIYNTNADTAAGAIAKRLNARRLIIISDVEGVLDDNKKLISEIDTTQINDLIKNETISGGMIPKIKNCLDVATNGVKGVVIIDGRKNHSILFELLSDKGSGTLIRQ